MNYPLPEWLLYPRKSWIQDHGGYKIPQYDDKEDANLHIKIHSYRTSLPRELAFNLTITLKHMTTINH